MSNKADTRSESCHSRTRAMSGVEPEPLGVYPEHRNFPSEAGDHPLNEDHPCGPKPCQSRRTTRNNTPHVGSGSSLSLMLQTVDLVTNQACLPHLSVKPSSRCLLERALNTGIGGLASTLPSVASVLPFYRTSGRQLSYRGSPNQAPPALSRASEPVARG